MGGVLPAFGEELAVVTEVECSASTSVQSRLSWPVSALCRVATALVVKVGDGQERDEFVHRGDGSSMCHLPRGRAGRICLPSTPLPQSLCPLLPGPQGCRETWELAPVARGAQSLTGQGSGQPQARGSSQNLLAPGCPLLLPEMWPQSRRHVYMQGSVLHPLRAVCPLLPSPGLQGGHGNPDWESDPPRRLGRHTGAASR